jgi:hypothetical protein
MTTGREVPLLLVNSVSLVFGKGLPPNEGVKARWRRGSGVSRSKLCAESAITGHGDNPHQLS